MLYTYYITRVIFSVNGFATRECVSNELDLPGDPYNALILVATAGKATFTFRQKFSPFF